MKRFNGNFFKEYNIVITMVLQSDISGSGQTRSAHALCAGIPKNDKDHYEVMGAGHYGIFAGRRWREKVYPKIKAFIREHQPAQRKTKARLPKLAAK